MSNVLRLFDKYAHAVDYAAFRPNPPLNVINRIVKYLNDKLVPPHNLAVDIGCGSGQSVGILAPHFENVLGIDISEAQINEAMRKETNKNVKYQTGSAYSIPVEKSSVRLITVSQAAHWFDLPTFYKEVDRALVPGGVLAIYCYAFPVFVNVDCADKLNEHLKHIYDIDMAGCFDDNRKKVDDRYKDMPMAYPDNQRHVDDLYMDSEWTIGNYIGYITTWSGYQALLKSSPEKAENALVSFQQKIIETLGHTASPQDIKVTVRWFYTMLLARKAM